MTFGILVFELVELGFPSKRDLNDRFPMLLSNSIKGFSFRDVWCLILAIHRSNLWGPFLLPRACFAVSPGGKFWTDRLLLRANKETTRGDPDACIVNSDSSGNWIERFLWIYPFHWTWDYCLPSLMDLTLQLLQLEAVWLDKVVFLYGVVLVLYRWLYLLGWLLAWLDGTISASIMTIS